MIRVAAVGDVHLGPDIAGRHRAGLATIADEASTGARADASARLPELSTLMNDFASANTRLMQQLGIEPDGS